jgi:uncharacterized protein (TIGR03000 family)
MSGDRLSFGVSLLAVATVSLSGPPAGFAAGPGSGIRSGSFHAAAFPSSGIHSGSFRAGAFPSSGIHSGSFRAGIFPSGGFRGGASHPGGFRFGGFSTGSFHRRTFADCSFARYRPFYRSNFSYRSYPFFTYYPYLPNATPYWVTYPLVAGYYGEQEPGDEDNMDQGPEQGGPDRPSPRREADGGPRDAYITVTVPASATVWFNGYRTTSRGPVRQFRSPPLTPGRRYDYEIRARWTEGGRSVTETKQITVFTGADIAVRIPLTGQTPGGRRGAGNG